MLATSKHKQAAHNRREAQIVKCLKEYDISKWLVDAQALERKTLIRGFNVRYASAIKGIKLVILHILFLKQILTLEPT